MTWRTYEAVRQQDHILEKLRGWKISRLRLDSLVAHKGLADIYREKRKIRQIPKSTQKVIRPKLPLDELRFDFRLKIRTQRKKLHLMMAPIIFS